VLARERGLARPEYSTKAENAGFPQMFTAEVRIGQELTAGGRGSSKKNAELEAARKLVEALETTKPH
jgi:dsRNA-specific ribonuclease